ncbi:MAG: class I SAM-dependent methyltransferase [Candidatus Krumholzibacteriia bacterium]
MHLFQRLVVNLREKGLRHTAALVWKRISVFLSKLGDLWFDIRHGTDTLDIVELEGLQVESGNKASGMRYEPTRARPLRRLLQAMAFPKAGGFIDFGCGKGRVLLVASAYGFERVVGVEFSPQLCRSARENLARFQAKTGAGGTVEIVECDVVDYPVRDDDTTFFLFNPFDGKVLAKVIANIVSSNRKCARTVWLIYHNPEFRRVVEEEPFFKRLGSYTFGGGEFVVYTNEV